MSDDYGFQGLSGSEIIEDLVAQFRKDLTADCNLRSYDSYSRGYSAKITYHLELYGLDKVEVDEELEVGDTQDDPDADIVDAKLSIEQEENIAKVRSRIENAKDDESEQDEDDVSEPVSAGAVRTKRKYTRKLQLASPSVIGGGAEAFKE